MTAASKTPATRIIARFGVPNLVKWTGRHRGRVHAWTWPRARGGTDGVVPHGVRALIISGAKTDLGVEVSFADFEPSAGERYLTTEERPADEDHVRKDFLQAEDAR